MNEQSPAAATALQRIPLKAVVCDAKLQVREKLHAPTVTKYRAAYLNGATLPPIRVVPAGASYLLIDGWHRVEALKQIDEDAWVDAEIVSADPSEVPWLAAQANLTHGLPLKKKEARRVFRAYVKAKRHRQGGFGFKSYRVMATELGGTISYATIRNWMRQDFPAVFRAIGGKESLATGGVYHGGVYVLGSVGLASEHLAQALAAFEATTQPDDRAAILKRAEKALLQMRGEAQMATRDPWETTDF